MKKLKQASIYIMGISYISVGISHFINPDFFLAIMPPYLPFHLQLVYLSGLIEIILGTFLMIRKFQRISAFGIIILLLAVYPANIYLAFNKEPQQLLNISPFMASWIRLPIQFILIGIAYWQSKID